jgi:tripartite-type tricarboxylate transporter receptor subunit TctC
MRGRAFIVLGLYANPGYDPRKDFAPIGLIAGLSSMLVVHPSLPVHSLAQLIAYAMARPAGSTMCYSACKIDPLSRGIGVQN